MNLLSVVKEVMKGNVVGKLDLQGYVEEYWKPVINAGAVKESYVEQLLLETYGGSCPVCETKWKPVTVIGQMEFIYFKPACQCYPWCPYCGRSLMAEVRNLDPVCSYCHVGPTCGEWVERAVQGHGRERKTVKGRCGGLMVPVLGGKFVCQDCKAAKHLYVSNMVNVA